MLMLYPDAVDLNNCASCEPYLNELFISRGSPLNTILSMMHHRKNGQAPEIFFVTSPVSGNKMGIFSSAHNRQGLNDHVR